MNSYIDKFFNNFKKLIVHSFKMRVYPKHSLENQKLQSSYKKLLSIVTETYKNKSKRPETNYSHESETKSKLTSQLIPVHRFAASYMIFYTVIRAD